MHLIPTVVQLPSGEPLSRGRASVTGENDGICALRPDGVPFCWGSVRQDSIFDPTSRPVEVASFRVNILPRASFAGGSQNLNVTVVANCLAGQHVQIEVQVEQAAARSSGHSAGRCQDGLAEYPVTVAAHGQPSFVAGPAAAVATVVIRETGQIVDTKRGTAPSRSRRDFELSARGYSVASPGQETVKKTAAFPHFLSVSYPDLKRAMWRSSQRRNSFLLPARSAA